MKRVAIAGVIQPGFPNPRLIEAGGGIAFLKGNVWYLYVESEYESDTGEYVEVTVVTVTE